MKVLSTSTVRDWRPWLTAAVLVWLSGAVPIRAEEGQGPLVGKPAPAFRVQGIYHETYSLDSFKGRILILQFGASW
jgi:cytochrome c biogenesis protein CcmG, thiol:disulfide interchange protein DsbE